MSIARNFLDGDRPAARPARPRRAPDRLLRRPARTCSPCSSSSAAAATRSRCTTTTAARRGRVAPRTLLDREDRRVGARRRGARRRRHPAEAPRRPAGRPPASRRIEGIERCRALGFTYFQATSSPASGGPAPWGRHAPRLVAARPGRVQRRRRLVRRPRTDHLLRRSACRSSCCTTSCRPSSRSRAASSLATARRPRCPAPAQYAAGRTVIAMSARPRSAGAELVGITLHQPRMPEVLAGSTLPRERDTMFTIGLLLGLRTA